MKKWGPITWYFFHTLSFHIYGAKFNEEKYFIIKLLKDICSILPCPYCKEHANYYIKNNPVENCNTQMDLIMYLFNFHNTVNLQTGKDAFNYDIFIKKYRSANLGNILNEFIKEYRKSNQSSHGIMLSVNKNNIIDDMITHFKKNKNNYSWTAR